MRLGKFIVTADTLKDLDKVQAITTFVSVNVIILEKIVAANPDGKQFAVFIGTCALFNECPDDTRKIPLYEVTFVDNLVGTIADKLRCEVKEVV